MMFIKYIYIITNLINNKFYIGQTKNLKKRWNEHKKAPTLKKYKNSHLYSAMKKHGVENFTFNILEKFESENEQETIDWANNLEQFLIDGTDSWNRKFGYNIDCGGKNSKKSEETKLKMSLSKIGKQYKLGSKISEEAKIKIGLSQKGIKEIKEKSKETKLKMSVAKKGKTWKSINGKRVWMNKEG